MDGATESHAAADAEVPRPLDAYFETLIPEGSMLIPDDELTNNWDQIDKNITAMQANVDMIKMWIGLIDRSGKFAQDSLRILEEEESNASRQVSEIRHLRRCVGDGLMASRQVNGAARLEILIRSDVAVQKVIAACSTCRTITAPFVNDTDSEGPKAVEEEINSDLDEDKFFMKPKTKRHAKAKGKGQG